MGCETELRGFFFIPGVALSSMSSLGLCNLVRRSSSRSFVSCVKVGDPHAPFTLLVRLTRHT